jgi:hypothetical protein
MRHDPWSTSLFCTRRAYATFARTVFHGKRPKCWNTMAARRDGPLTRVPSSLITPDETGTRPAIARSMEVDRPAQPLIERSVSTDRYC